MDVDYKHSYFGIFGYSLLFYNYIYNIYLIRIFDDNYFKCM